MEEKKVSILKKIENNILLQVAFFLVSMAVIVGVYVGLSEHASRQFTIVEDDFSWMYQVDSIEEIDGELVLKGWAFELGKDATREKFDIILYNRKEDKSYYPKMEYEVRKDVNEYFACEFDYENCGFVAKIDLKKIDVDECEYEVLLHVKEGREAFATSIYYYNQKMNFISQDEFVPLQTEGTDLEEITKAGVLRLYRPDTGMYIYQYDGALYWITEDKYHSKYGDSYVQYEVNTNQIDRLPAEKQEKNQNWMNLSFSFAEYELSDRNTGSYRATKYVLPKGYAITKVWPGVYVEQWDWQGVFRPWYDFED